MLVAALALCACGSSPGTQQVDTPAAPALDLTGRWKSPCVDPGSGQAIRLTFDLTADTWDLAYEVFGDVACASPFLTVDIAGPYSLGGPAASVQGAREGRFVFAARTVTPASDAAASFLQTNCGGGPFATGVATDISGGCAALGAYPHSSCPADHDIVAREGDTIRFGQRPADNDMCSEAKRPTALSPLALTRQP
jgi:hypothetical protein